MTGNRVSAVVYYVRKKRNIAGITILWTVLPERKSLSFPFFGPVEWARDHERQKIDLSEGNQ